MDKMRFCKILLLMLLVAFVFSLILPIVVRAELQKWMLAQGADEARVGKLIINLFQGRIAIHGLEAQKAGQPGLIIGRFSAELDYADLWEKRVNLADIRLADSELPLTVSKTGFSLGALFWPATQDEGEEPQSVEDNGWQFGLDSLGLSNIRLVAELDEQQLQLELDHGSFSDLRQWQPPDLSSLSLAGRLNGSDFDLGSQGSPLADRPNGQLKLSLDHFPLHSVLSPWLPGFKAYLNTDLTYRLTWDGKHLNVVQSGPLALVNVEMEQGALVLGIGEGGWDGEVRVELEKQGLAALQAQGELSLQALQLQQPGLVLEESSIVWKADIRSSDGHTLDLSGAVAAAPSTLQWQHLGVERHGAVWEGEAQVDLSAGALKSLQGVLSVEGLVLADQVRTPVMSLERLSIKGLRFENREVQSLSIDKLLLEGLASVKERFITAARIEADGLEMPGLSRFEIDQVQGHDLNAAVILDKEGKPTRWMALIEALSGGGGGSASEAGQEQQVAVEDAEGDDVQPIAVNINRVVLLGDSYVRFNDRSVDPDLKAEIKIERFEINDLNTASTETSPLVVKARINEFGSLNIDARYAFFADQPRGEWQGQLAQLELHRFSPYTGHFTGYLLKSGQLALETQGALKAGEVDSQNHLTLHKFILEKIDEDKAAETTALISMPLETAVAILTDDNDDVVLDIPIKGVLDDPQFGYQSVVNIVLGKVVKEAALGYLTASLQPYGALFSLAKMAVDAGSAAAIGLESVPFPAGGFELDANGRQYLDNISHLMQERSGLRISLCGRAVNSDVEFLREQLKSEALADGGLEPSSGAEDASTQDADEPGTDKSFDTQIKPLLTALAGQRGVGVKSYLVDSGVSGERLFSCLPQVMPDSAERPGVALSL